MSETRGSFVLSDLVLKKLNDDWINSEDTWRNDDTPNTGYFGGGSPGPISTMDKVIYSTDTTVPASSANLTVPREHLAATGNSVAGYFGGGAFPLYSTVEKVTYSSDTTAAIPGSPLSSARRYLAATGNLVAGYFGGGGGGATMDKFTYSTDTRTLVPAASLSSVRDYLSATGNSNAGYFGGGGSNPSPVSIIDKLIYSTETTATVPTALLTSNRRNLSATGNSVAGYFGGGNTGGFPGVNVSTMDKVTYIIDTAALAPNAFLTGIVYKSSATGNSVAGYFGGGNPGLSRIDKISYYTDTRSTSGNLTTVRNALAASSARANALPALNLTSSRNFVSNQSSTNSGYFGGGFDGNAVVTIMDKISYSTDTRSTSFILTTPRQEIAATGNVSAGYFVYGSNTSGGVVSAIDKLIYATDSLSSSPGAALSVIRRGIAATGNSTAGYFGGGVAASPVPNSHSTMNKLSYSTETSTALTTSPLGLVSALHAATGNQTVGYFGGTSSRTTIDKLTYSTDSIQVAPGASLSSLRANINYAASSSIGGYFGGGTVGPSYVTTMDKITYSTDTTAQVPSASLSVARAHAGAAGNSSSGYFGGGTAPSRFSTTDKVSYSTDTTSVVPNAFLSVSRYSLGASSSTGNALPQQTQTPTLQAVQGNAGYFNGSSAFLSTVCKINYTTDTLNVIPSVLINTRSQHMSVSSLSAGYFAGGVPSPVISFTSAVDKIVYSTEVIGDATSTRLLVPLKQAASAGNSIASYFGGGYAPGAPQYYSNTNKLSYSNDTIQSAPSTAFITRTTDTYGMTATGNSSAGYFGGGGQATYVTTMLKLTYSTETMTQAPNSSLGPAGRHQIASTGNKIAGYFGGGGQAPFTTNVTTVEKVLYSTDTSAAVPSAAINARQGHAATGNLRSGYFGGGINSGGGTLNSIDKIEYSTDTRFQISTLDTARTSFSATSQVENGMDGTLGQATVI